MDTQSKIDAIIERCALSRDWFVRNVLDFTPDPWQSDFFAALDAGETRLSLRSGHGTGKALSLSTVLPTPSGYRVWGDLRAGDLVFGSNGSPTRILATYPQGVKPIYAVTFSDGSVSETCLEHLWNVKGRNDRRTGGDWVTMSTKDIMDAGVLRSNGAAMSRQWEIPRQGAAQYPEQDLPVDPYVLGVWLGDGTSSNGSITNGDAGVWDRLSRQFDLGSNVYRGDTARTHTLLGLVGVLRSVGVLGNKHIPEQYLIGSFPQRLDLLRGLMDSDGCNGSGAEYGSVREGLVDGVIELARSLGLYAVKNKSKTGWYNDKDGNRVDCQEFYRCRVTSNTLNPFWLPRKAKAFQFTTEERYVTRWIESIEYSHDEEAMCITVDAADSLYLTKDYVVTHNTCGCALTAIHFLLFRPGSTKVIITSPSSAQLKDGMLAELIMWLGRLPDFLGEQLEVRGTRIVDVNNPETRFISLRTARIEAPEALAGVHAENVLLLVDEASGVPEPVFEAAAGTLSTVGAVCVLIGNPTRTTGYFYRTQTTLADHWKCFHIVSTDCPRVSKSFIEDIKRTYGVESAQYKIRVLGEFADMDNDVIIRRALAEAALGRDIVPLPDDPVFYGVDVGRGGDPSGFVVRKGGVVTYIREHHFDDTMKLVNTVFDYWQLQMEKPEHVFVDVIGIGAGVADRLRELGLPVVDVNVAEAPAVKTRYPRLRDELWYNAQEWFESRRVTLPNDDFGRQLVEELVSPLVVLSEDGRSRAESKKDMKARGVMSPNLADALNLTFSFGAAVIAGRVGKNGSWGKPLSRGLQGVA